MSLPHQTALDRETEERLTEHLAAHRHPRVLAGWVEPGIQWTPANVLKFVALVALGVAAVAGVAVSGWSLGSSFAAGPEPPPPFSVDLATPRGVLGAYFMALSEDDLDSAVDLLCESDRKQLLDTRFVEETAAALGAELVGSVTSTEPWPVRLGDAAPLGDGNYVVEATDEDGITGHFLVVEQGGEYRVCGFA